MEFFGLTTEDYPEFRRNADVWPENWSAVTFFDALGFGSWNMGMNGPTGLRYETFREVRLARGISDQEWPEIFEQLRILEAAALEEMMKDTD
jgi:hypothetical protein